MKHPKQLKLVSEKAYLFRKVARPISLRAWNHVVLKASTPILRKNHRMITSLIMHAQEKYHFKMKSLAIMPDHVHMLIQVSSRGQFANTFRFLGGQIARRVGRGKLWRKRIWSRMVIAKRDIKNATLYIARNSIKAGIFWLHRDAILILNGYLYGERLLEESPLEQMSLFGHAS